MLAKYLTALSTQAESLLRECLSLQAEGPPALGGRAATMQQLARVMERRGDRDAALAHLADALALHRQAYGEGVPADPESNPIPSQTRSRVKPDPESHPIPSQTRSRVKLDPESNPADPTGWPAPRRALRPLFSVQRSFSSVQRSACIGYGA